MNDFWWLLILCLLLLLAESMNARFILFHHMDIPWFWSTQGERRLQIAGLALADDEAHIVDINEAKGKLVVERLRAGQVVAVETINAPGPHMKARRRLAQTVPHGDLAVAP